MAFEQAFRELMPFSIVVKRFSKATTAGSTQGTYGAPGYTTLATTYAGRLVLKHTRTMRADGSEFVGDHVAWLATTASIGQRDKVTFSGSTFEILGVGRYPDEDGQHHTKLILRRSTA